MRCHVAAARSRLSQLGAIGESMAIDWRSFPAPSGDRSAAARRSKNVIVMHRHDS